MYDDSQAVRGVINLIRQRDWTYKAEFRPPAEGNWRLVLALDKLSDSDRAVFEKTADRDRNPPMPAITVHVTNEDPRNKEKTDLSHRHRDVPPGWPTAPAGCPGSTGHMLTPAASGGPGQPG